LWVCWFGAPYLTRGRICHLQMLLALTRAVTLDSEFRGTHGPLIHPRQGPRRNHRCQKFLHCFLRKLLSDGSGIAAYTGVA
jgi:hypothetical protein